MNCQSALLGAATVALILAAALSLPLLIGDAPSPYTGPLK